jgi:protein involved in polysaccharide export with SLBB domain
MISTGKRPARWLAGAALVLLGGCLGHHPKLGPMPGPALVPVVASEPYRIQPGDELEIRFFHTPEQNVTLPVRPDGFIALPLAYEVRAAGRTVEELRLELVDRCSRELASPEIAVIVRNISGYQVHVGGEVDKPGVLELTGPRTVLEAVFAAGGFLPTASLADVIVVRRIETGGYELVAADLDKVLDGKDARGNLALRPFDVVYVPRSPIADVNRWMDLYIRQNIPITFTYRLDAPND